MKKLLIILSLMGFSATQVNASVQDTYNPSSSEDLIGNLELLIAQKQKLNPELKALETEVINRQSSLASFATSSNTPSRSFIDSSAPPAIAAARAARAAHSRTIGLCARYVRKALQSAGYDFTPNPSAYQYATRGTLAQAGFVKISNSAPPQVGDVVVYNRSAKHRHGHIQIFDGSNWVSDFVQRNKSPYSDTYSYTTWRDARYINDASNQGVYLAMGE